MKLFLTLFMTILMLMFWGFYPAFKSHSADSLCVSINETVYCQYPEILITKDGTAHFMIYEINYKSFCQKMQILKIFQAKKAVITLMTYGGSLFDALAIAEEIEHSGIEIAIFAKGLVASAGMVILVSAKERIATDDTIFMFHEFVEGKLFVVESPSDKEEQALEARWLQDRIIKYICQRTKLNFSEFKNSIRRKNKWFTAEEALSYGLVTKVVRQP